MKPAQPERPEKKFKVGGISASVWKHTSTKDGQNYDYKTVSIDRTYKDDKGAWKHTASFRLADLPKASLVLQKAYEYLALNNDANESSPEQIVA